MINDTINIIIIILIIIICNLLIKRQYNFIVPIILGITIIYYSFTKNILYSLLFSLLFSYILVVIIYNNGYIFDYKKDKMDKIINFKKSNPSLLQQLKKKGELILDVINNL